MAQNFQWNTFVESATSSLTTELNTLASGSVSTASAAVTSNQDQYALLELFVNFPSAPTDGRSVIVFALPSIDGTNYNDVTDPIDPGNILAIFRVRAVNTDQRITKRAMLPPGNFKIAVKNDTDQAMKSTLNTVKYRRFDEQY